MIRLTSSKRTASAETPLLVWPGNEAAALHIAMRCEPWDRPFLCWYGPDYEPREKFSPSGLKVAGECERRYYYRYVAGIREYEFDWAFMSQVQKPKHDNKRVQADLTRIYNKRRGPALGKASHAVLEQHYKWIVAGPHSVRSSYENWAAQWEPGKEPKEVTKAQWESEPGRIALSGLHLLPHPEHFVWADVEGQIRLDSTAFAPELEPVQFNGYRDLFVRLHDESKHSKLADYKTFRDKTYIPTPKERQTPAQIRADVTTPQALALSEQPAVYGLDVMTWQGTEHQDCDWVYFGTEGKPHAEVVSFRVHREHAEQQCRSLAFLADGLRQKMRLRLAEEHWRQNPDACEAYGGCPYRAAVGGPCEAPQPSFLQRIKSNPYAQTYTPKERATPMSTGFRAARQQAKEQRGQAPQQPEQTIDPGVDPGAAPEQYAPPQQQAQAPQQPAPRRGRPPAQQRAAQAPAPQHQSAHQGAVGASDNSIVVVFGGTDRVAVAEGTPLYDRLAKLHAANFG